MQDLNVTLVQANQIWEDKTANLTHFSSLLKDIDPTDLIVFPEMFHTAFTMNAEKMAEKMEDSSGIAWLKATAHKKNAACYASLIIEENNQYFNRGVFVFPDGKLAVYDKRKRFGLAGEKEVFTAGEKECIVEYKGWKINLQICYDLRFPENIRNGIEKGIARYDILIYVANWPEARSTHWKVLTQARAIENQCYVIAVNRVGADAKKLTYSGDSTCFDLLGNKLVETPVGMECTPSCILKSTSLMENREKLPFLADSFYRSFDI
jgi:omega-amidase